MPTKNDFIQLVTQHQKIIHKVCNLYTHNEQDNKDLFQEVMLAAWKGYRNFKGDAKFSTWLYRVALNTAITLYRKEQRQVATSPYQEAYAQPMADTPFKEEEQLTAMHKAIAALSAIDKALVMLYLEDCNYQEIGDIMGISPNNVAVKMNRIKIKLKENSKKYL